MSIKYVVKPFSRMAFVSEGRIFRCEYNCSCVCFCVMTPIDGVKRFDLYSWKRGGRDGRVVALLIAAVPTCALVLLFSNATHVDQRDFDGSNTGPRHHYRSCTYLCICSREASLSLAPPLSACHSVLAAIAARVFPSLIFLRFLPCLAAFPSPAWQNVVLGFRNEASLNATTGDFNLSRRAFVVISARYLYDLSRRSVGDGVGVGWGGSGMEVCGI